MSSNQWDYSRGFTAYNANAPMKISYRKMNRSTAAGKWHARPRMSDDLPV